MTEITRRGFFTIGVVAAASTAMGLDAIAAKIPKTPVHLGNDYIDRLLAAYPTEPRKFQNEEWFLNKYPTTHVGDTRIMVVAWPNDFYKVATITREFNPSWGQKLRYEMDVIGQKKIHGSKIFEVYQNRDDFDAISSLLHGLSTLNMEDHALIVNMGRSLTDTIHNKPEDRRPYAFPHIRVPIEGVFEPYAKLFDMVLRDSGLPNSSQGKY